MVSAQQNTQEHALGFYLEISLKCRLTEVYPPAAAPRAKGLHVWPRTIGGSWLLLDSGANIKVRLRYFAPSPSPACALAGIIIGRMRKLVLSQHISVSSSSRLSSKFRIVRPFFRAPFGKRPMLGCLFLVWFLTVWFFFHTVWVVWRWQYSTLGGKPLVA